MTIGRGEAADPITRPAQMRATVMSAYAGFFSLPAFTFCPKV